MLAEQHGRTTAACIQVTNSMQSQRTCDERTVSYSESTTTKIHISNSTGLILKLSIDLCTTTSYYDGVIFSFFLDRQLRCICASPMNRAFFYV